MNCEDVVRQLQDRLDRPRSSPVPRAGEGALGDGLLEHVAACTACEKDFRRLKWIVRSIKALPAFSPSSAFADDILESLGLEAVRERLPRWALWSIGAAGSSVSLWAAVLLALAESRLSVGLLARAWGAATHPTRLWVKAQLLLADSAAWLGHASAAVRDAAHQLAMQEAALPLELIFAAILCAAFMTTVLKRSAHTASWRTL